MRGGGIEKWDLGPTTPVSPIGITLYTYIMVIKKIIIIANGPAKIIIIIMVIFSSFIRPGPGVPPERARANGEIPLVILRFLLPVATYIHILAPSGVSMIFFFERITF